ncbi:2-oxoacid:ferredoxin oxidoreductase subunit beta [Patescibacteria group bacterium]|nr:2-oxoacid:ferredoxin oxidoreductase subunit beta [Patescibacteria group bacterium]MBU1895702.1 2-oxoacid:ferredoxin oxidoreductase subunit beta [Patescibacteria group bacterium]
MDTKSFDTQIKPTWCPGCGNYGIFGALKQALAELNLKPNELVVFADIGCSGNMADFLKCYMFHSLHGRAIPPAVGAKLANHGIPVLVIIGDGGAYGEGGNHFLNEMRGNHDITVLVHDNYIYGLTTGQFSPTTFKGTKTKTTPEGAIEEPLNPLALALANHTTFAARSYAFDIPGLTDLIVKAVQHKGFSLVDILQPCVTFNKDQTMKWYQENIFKLNKKFKTREEAFAEALKTDKFGTGIFWQEKKLVYHEEDVVLKQRVLVDKKIDRVNIKDLVEEFV